MFTMSCIRIAIPALWCYGVEVLLADLGVDSLVEAHTGAVIRSKRLDEY
jgi:uncharacterized membrane protein YccF (DUF307 family)